MSGEASESTTVKNAIIELVRAIKGDTENILAAVLKIETTAKNVEGKSTGIPTL